MLERNAAMRVETAFVVSVTLGLVTKRVVLAEMKMFALSILIVLSCEQSQMTYLTWTTIIAMALPLL